MPATVHQNLCLCSEHPMEQHLTTFPVTPVPISPSQSVLSNNRVYDDSTQTGGETHKGEYIPPSKRPCFDFHRHLNDIRQPNCPSESNISSKSTCLGALSSFKDSHFLTRDGSHTSFMPCDFSTNSNSLPVEQSHRDSISPPISCETNFSNSCVERNLSTFAPSVSQPDSTFFHSSTSSDNSAVRSFFNTLPSYPINSIKSNSSLESHELHQVNIANSTLPETTPQCKTLFHSLHTKTSDASTSCQHLCSDSMPLNSVDNISTRVDTVTLHDNPLNLNEDEFLYKQSNEKQSLLKSLNSSVPFLEKEIQRLEFNNHLKFECLKTLLTNKQDFIKNQNNLRHFYQKTCVATSFLADVESEIDMLEKHLCISLTLSSENNAFTKSSVSDPVNQTSCVEMNSSRSWFDYYEELCRQDLTKTKFFNNHWMRFLKLRVTLPSASDADINYKENRRYIRFIDYQNYLRKQILGYHVVSFKSSRPSSSTDELHCHPFTGLPPLLYITSRDCRRYKFLAQYRIQAHAILQEQEERKRLRFDFLKNLQKHRVRFIEFHAKIIKLCKRLAHSALKLVLASNDKRNSLGLSLTEIQFSKERMAALKAKDEVHYLKLLRETKNHRLIELVHQTEEYMNKLGHLVTRHRKSEQQKENNGVACDTLNASPSANTIVNDYSLTHDSNGQHFDALIAAKNHYFTLTHTIQEDIVKIPSCLVGGALREYQLKGLTWMVSLYNNNLNGILADAMGLGKTIQTIALLAYLYEFKRNKGPFLIVAPLSTLHSGWNTEFNRWLPSFVKVVYDGSKDTRRALRQKYFSDISFNVLLTTDSFIMKDCTYLRKIHWEYLIVDEAHRLKNPRSKLVQVLTDKRQSRGFRIKRRLALTGTPLQNDLQEVWSLLNFLMPAIFSSSETFRSWFNAPLGQAGSQHHVGITEEEQLLVVDRLHKVLRPFLLRREKKEVENEVPRKHEEVLWCPMSGLQQRLYRDIEHGDVSADISLSSNTLMQLRKVCNHPFLFCLKTSLGFEIPTDESIIRLCGKFWVLDDILPKLYAAKHRVLIFSQMVKLLNILEIFLSVRGWRFLRLDGSTSSEERLRRLSLFNAPDSPYFIFALSTRAGGLGVNLQTADTVIIYDSDWNPQNDEQAQSRAHRIGQTKEVLILRLVTGDTVEERILSAASVKLDKDALVIKSGMFYDSGNDLENERRDKVRAILSKKNKKQEILFYERESLNRALARHKNDLHIFSRVDQLRQTLGLGNLIQSSALPDCLLRIEKNPSTTREDWKAAYNRDCLWSLHNKTDYASPRGAKIFALKKAALNDAVLEAIEFVKNNSYFGTHPKDVEPFNKIPDSKECHGYQDIVDQPMCLDYIKTFAERRNFSSLIQLEKYLSRISSNCRKFNGPDHCLFYQALRVSGSVLYRARENCCRMFADICYETGTKSKKEVDRVYKILNDIELLSQGKTKCENFSECDDDKDDEEDDDEEEEDDEEDDEDDLTDHDGASCVTITAPP